MTHPTAIPTGRAIRTGDGYGLYHAETAYPNGDTDVACRQRGIMFGHQEYPDGWDACAAAPHIEAAANKRFEELLDRVDDLWNIAQLAESPREVCNQIAAIMADFGGEDL